MIGLIALFLIIYTSRAASTPMASGRRGRRGRRLLPGGGHGSEFSPMHHSPNVYVGIPKGTGYEPWNYPMYGDPWLNPYIKTYPYDDYYNDGYPYPFNAYPYVRYY